MCLNAQSVVLNDIINNPEKYESVREQVALHFNNHPVSYKKFPLVGAFDMYIPRQTPIKDVHVEIKAMISEGKILVGTLQMPTVYYSYNILTNNKSVKLSHVRIIPLLKIRMKMLEKQQALGVLKQYPDEHYSKMDRITCLKELSRYNVFYEDEITKKTSLDSLRNMLKATERTRLFAIWYDHATILGYSMLVFTFTCICTENVFRNNGPLMGRVLQNKVESPELYMIGYSKSNVEASELLAEYRRPDCVAMSIPVSASTGIEFNDRLRAFFGDQPTRTDEASHNRTGHYRMSNLMHDLRDRLSFAEVLALEHLNLEELQKKANKGGFFNDASNIGKNLQDNISLHLAKLRGISRIGRTEKETVEATYKDLAGIKNVPIILRNNPNQELASINMEHYEIQPYETLHDGKATINISLSIIPGKSALLQIDRPLHEKLFPIICRFENDLYRLKNQKSGETVFQMLIDIVHELQSTFCLLNNKCTSMCGALFTTTTSLKCIQCSIIRYYRCLVEIVGYSHAAEDRRNVFRVCRGYGLTYILYNTLLDLKTLIPGLETDKLLGSVHFIDIIFYFPLMHELHNLLTFHAGRHESKFKQIKDIALNNTNRHVTTDSFTLQILIRLSQEEQYKDEFEKTGLSHSVVSKKLSKLFYDFPPENLVFSARLMNDHNFQPDMLKLFERLSNFLVDNNPHSKSGHAYFSTDEHNSWIINIPECTCYSEAQSSATVRCMQCDVSTFPSYNISNLLTSDISRLIKEKKKLYETSYCQSIVKTILKPAVNDCNISPHTKPSIQVLSAVHIDMTNEAQERFRPTLKFLSKELDIVLKDENSKIDFSGLVNSPLISCIAKLLGCCSDEFKKADKKEGFRYGQDVKSDIFYDLKRQYIRFLHKARGLLFDRLKLYDNKLELACKMVDEQYFMDMKNDEEKRSSTNNLSVSATSKHELKRLQKVRLVGTKVLETVEELINNNYVRGLLLFTWPVLNS